MRSNDLIQSLVSIRRKLRVLLIIDGLGRLIIGAALVFAVFAFLDWWVRFPSYVRMFILGVLVSWGAVWVLRRIARPLMSSISLEQLALKLGRLTPETRDRLASAVTYMHGGGQGSPVLWGRVVENALESTDATPLSVGLNSRKPLRAGSIAAIALILVTIFHVLSPSFSSIAWKRLTKPLGSTRWPNSVVIEPLTRDVVVAYGEYFTAEMRLQRGYDPNLRAFVICIQPDGRRQRFLMDYDSDGVYRHTFENVRTSVSYAFAAGDDDTLASPYAVRVVRRPTVSSARFVFKPPTYAQTRPDEITPLLREPVVAVAGSHARLEIVCNKNVNTERNGNNLLFEDGRTFKLKQNGSTSNVLIGEFTVEKGGLFRIALTDADGLQSHDEHRYQLIVREDELPKVAIVKPVGELELTTRGRLNLAVHAHDDFGVESLRILAAHNRGEMVEVGNLLKKPDEPSTEINRTYVWQVGSISPAPKPGDSIEYVAEAQDNFKLNDRRHEPVRSALRRIRIVSVSQLAELLRQSLLDSRGTLRRLLADLQAVQNESARLDVEPERPLGDGQKETAAQLARELQRLTGLGREISRRIQRTADRAEMNQASRLDVALQAQRVAEKLRRLTDDVARKAAESLMSAVEASELPEQRDHLRESLQNQDKLASALREMLSDLDRWNEYADIVRRTREILDRQETLTRDVIRLGRILGGQAIAALEAAQRSELQRSFSRQSQLKLDTDALSQNMKQLSIALSTSDPAASGSLDRAVETAHQLTVADEMEDAAEEIRENRLNRAKQYQLRAAEALRAILSMLEEKPDRELAALSRKLEDLIGRLTKLIRRQRDLIDRASMEPDSESLLRLIARQTSLAETATDVASRVNATDFEGLTARAEIMTSITHMQSAVKEFGQDKVSSAVEAQRQALDALETARELLQKLQERTDRLIAERSMAAILDFLVDLRESQSALKRETETIEARQTGADRLSRVDGLKLNGIAKRQKDLIKPLEQVNEKIGASVIYRHVCKKTKRLMQQAAERLRAHDCPEALTYQGRVLQHLNRLIAALQDRPQRRKEEFVAMEGGGGGAGAPSVSKPVPTLAELKVLRMLQEDVNERTRSWNVSLPDPLLRTEAQLRQTEALGNTQREIHDLAIQMIEKTAKTGS